MSLPLNVSAACQGESPPIRGNAHTAFEVDSAGCARAMRLLLDARYREFLADPACWGTHFAIIRVPARAPAAAASASRPAL